MRGRTWDRDQLLALADGVVFMGVLTGHGLALCPRTEAFAEADWESRQLEPRAI